MVFNAGHDFPTVVLDDFRSWSINLDVGHMKDKPSARGLVYYDRGDSNSQSWALQTAVVWMLTLSRERLSAIDRTSSRSS